MNRLFRPAAMAVALVASMSFAPVGHAADPLPSWNDGTARQSIVAFVERVTREGSPDFVPAAERIATFDNDGTLWGEQPLYFQLFFALDRVKALAPLHPEWKDQEPFASLLKGDVNGALAGGEWRHVVAREYGTGHTCRADRGGSRCARLRRRVPGTG